MIYANKRLTGLSLALSLGILAACGGTHDAETKAVDEPIENAVADAESALTDLNGDIEAVTNTSGQIAVDVAEALAPKIVAATIYADWCGGCKTLDPKIEAAKAAQSYDGLAFVTLDYTTKDAELFYAQAQALGIEAAVREALNGNIKTGQVFVIDVENQKVLSRITKDFDAETIQSTLADSIT